MTYGRLLLQPLSLAILRRHLLATLFQQLWCGGDTIVGNNSDSTCQHEGGGKHASARHQGLV